MTGLIYKDFLALKGHLTTYLVFFLVYGGLCLSGVFTASVLCGMVVLMSLITPMTTVTSDDVSRWNRFAIATPACRRGVVTGKYLFTLLVTLASTVFVSLLLVVLALAGGLEEPLSELLLSALACAGVFDVQTAVALTAFRGKAMAAAAAGRTCGMTAVLGLDEAPLQACCNAAADEGVVQICNYNCPGQLVIGGDKAAVDKAAELALSAGARRCLPLNVSGPFHTSLMHPAGDALREKCKAVRFAPMQFPVLFNCLGHEMEETDTIAALLEKQVQSGVRWEVTVRRLAELGVDAAIEIGPGRALTGFVKKTVGSAISCYPVETAAQLQQLLRTMKGA